MSIDFLRLNFIDTYNSFMGYVDIADQLWGQYRPDVWMRQRKWWWAIFLWEIGTAAVNAYLIYSHMHDDEVKKKRGGLGKKWTHLQFQEQLALNLIWTDKAVQSQHT